MPVATIRKGKGGGGQIGVERDQGLRRWLLKSHPCNSQKHVTSTQESASESQGPEAS